MNNPFAVTSPEQLTTEQAEQLFVEVFSDFPQVEKAGNAMIVGARGSGKSMMFRCLLPDVIMKRNNCQFSDLPFVAFHIPIKNLQLKLTELARFDDNYASSLINEHFFVVVILQDICEQITRYREQFIIAKEEAKIFYDDVFKTNASIAGCDDITEINVDIEDCFDKIHSYARTLYAGFVRYITSLNPAENSNLPLYNLPLLSFRMFLLPFLHGLRGLSRFPKGKNIHLFFDDADNLSKTQTQILNSWLGMRTQPVVSIKVSTQLGKYKSYLSTDGTLVESPHDYQNINISDKYTTSKTTYFRRVDEIVAKRLKSVGIGCKPKDYFPEYEEQEEKIRQEKKRLLEVWAREGAGNRPSDDVNRYARPNYIRNLGGISKSRSTYRYAGFEQMVHLSSGVIRVFLDAASLMFEETKKENPNSGLESRYIPDAIQNNVLRDFSEDFMFGRFERLNVDAESGQNGEGLSVVAKLRNLIFSMGKTFYNILVSDRSERRVFSIALSNTPDKEIKDVLDFGVQTGYFHSSTIGRKDGAGRTNLYIMNRILAPQFNLDPTGFAGYLFVTNEALRSAMYTQRILRTEEEKAEEPRQLTLFE